MSQPVSKLESLKVSTKYAVSSKHQEEELPQFCIRPHSAWGGALGVVESASFPRVSGWSAAQCLWPQRSPLLCRNWLEAVCRRDWRGEHIVHGPSQMLPADYLAVGELPWAGALKAMPAFGTEHSPQAGPQRPANRSRNGDRGQGVLQLPLEEWETELPRLLSSPLSTSNAFHFLWPQVSCIPNVLELCTWKHHAWGSFWNPSGCLYL